MSKLGTMLHGDGCTAWQKNKKNRFLLLEVSMKCASVVREGIFEGLWGVGCARRSQVLSMVVRAR